MVEGVWEMLQARRCSIGIYRDEATLKPVQYYTSCLEPRVSVC
jgi:uracil phosphoribosyltransferase